MVVTVSTKCEKASNPKLRTRHLGNKILHGQNLWKLRAYRCKLGITFWEFFLEGTKRILSNINWCLMELESGQESLSLAKKSGDDKKMKQVAARRKKLDSHMGLEKNEKGHHFQINK
jgi:hypothetical protein